MPFSDLSSEHPKFTRLYEYSRKGTRILVKATLKYVSDDEASLLIVENNGLHAYVNLLKVGIYLRLFYHPKPTSYSVVDRTFIGVFSVMIEVHAFWSS